MSLHILQMSDPCSDDQQTQGIDGEPDAREDTGENDGNFYYN